MKNIWDLFSELSRYYIKSMLSFLLFWIILVVLKIDYLNIVFFILTYIWHFTLLTPGLKEKMLVRKQRFSFLNVIIRINYYLQLFIKIKNVPFGPALVRSISPLLFIFILMTAGGNGNFIFAVLGSFSFEMSYYLTNRKIISTPPNDQEMPPAIPNAESFHE
jgi:hypothetical protein